MSTLLDPRSAARAAAASSPSRPATALLHDSADARLLVFRIGPGQEVPAHRNTSTVVLTVLAGEGVLEGSDGGRTCRAGDVVVYAPNETHAMRSVDGELHLLAVITPRPGERRAPAAPERAAAVR